MFTQTQNKKILGIDPGFGRIGIAILEKTSSGDKMLHSECFETDPKLSYHQRLVRVGGKIEEIVDQFKPEELAIETLLFSKNQKTALQVSEARGVIIFTVAKCGIKIREFNPNQVKLAVTGDGRADKKQVINMVDRIIKMPVLKTDTKRHDDEYDAVAIAIAASSISLSTTDK